MPCRRNCPAGGERLIAHPPAGMPCARRDRLRSNLMRVAGAALFGLGLWEIVALTVQSMRGIPFPTPFDCAIGLVQLMGGSPFLDFTIYEHTLASCARWVSGFVLAYGAGIAYAFAAFWCPLFRAVSMPTVEVLQLIPGLAWVPVVILLFGLSPASTLAIIVLTTFPVIAVSAAMGFSSADTDHVRVGLMCGYGFWGLLRSVYLPSALPHILSGTRIALGVSWRVLVAAEMVVGSGEGLGFAIIQSRWTMDYVSAFVCIIIIALIGLGLERLILLPLERRTIKRWEMSHEH